MNKDASSLVADAEFMRGKLSDMRGELADAPLVIPYDNGGGQKGTRKNPAFDAYESLLKTFCTAVRTLKEIGTGEPETDERVIKFEAFAQSMRKHA